MKNDWNMHPDMHNLLTIPATTECARSNHRQGDQQIVEAARAAWGSFCASLDRPCPPTIRVTDSEIPGCDDGSRPAIGLRIYRPETCAKNAPCVLFLHGGGFIMGDLDSSDTIAWGIADLSGAIVISVDYRLAPEYPYPAALEDCYRALEYCEANATQLEIDANRIAVWGVSAGAALAAALCLLSRDRAGPRVCAQILTYPCLTDDFSAPSYSEYAEAPGLSTTDMHFYWNQYLGDRRPISDPCAVPLKAQDLSKLPATCIQIAEIDPLADDGRIYAARLEQAGVDSCLRVATGMIHGYLHARFDGPGAAAEFAAPCEFLRRRFSVNAEA